jgi:hypothetical protein
MDDMVALAVDDTPDSPWQDRLLCRLEAAARRRLRVTLVDPARRSPRLCGSTTPP